MLSEALTFDYCTLELSYACGFFGCGCVNGTCSGGNCEGNGCTAAKASECTAGGCGCVDGECSGGSCAGTGCTAKETADCLAEGNRACANHACVGATATAVGATDGTFSVGQAGDASYSIPIQVVPGTAGIEPSLSFAYNSSGADSPLGVGWMLSGESAITRCAANLAQDGFIDPVDFDEHDRFCLDGQRLVVVNGSAYGADGAEYRTELESYARIYSYGAAPGGGPERFLVQQKSGEVIQYGYTADSRVEAWFKPIVFGSNDPYPPRVVARWAINRVEDRSGNYLTYNYSESPPPPTKEEFNSGFTADNYFTQLGIKNASISQGEHFLARVDYTGNTAAGLTPYASVRLEYETRPDPLEGYQFGAYSRMKLRLKRVLVFSGESPVRRYRLDYAQRGPAGRTVLTGIQECAADRTCLPPTTFGMSAEAPGFETNTQVAIPANAGGLDVRSTQARHEAFVDLDGDGDLDRAWIPHGLHSIYAMLWNGASFDPPTVWLSGPPTPTGTQIPTYSNEGRYEAWVDVNADSKTDRAWVPYGLQEIYVALSNGTSFGAPSVWLSEQSLPGIRLYSDQGTLEEYDDADGDGLVDRIWRPLGRGEIYVALNTGSAFTTPHVWAPSPIGVPVHLISNQGQDFVDVNGDGRADYVGGKFFALSNGTSFEPAPFRDYGVNLQRLRPNDSASYVDMTGDGLLDLVVTGADATTAGVTVGVNDGKGFRPQLWLSGDQTSSDPTKRIASTDPRHEQLVDLNDDDRPDRVWLNPITNTIWVAFNKVEYQANFGLVRYGFSTPQELIPVNGGVTPASAIHPTDVAAREAYLDITGDGAPDKIWIPSGALEFRLIRGKPVSDRIDRFTNGFGYERQIVYSTLLNRDVYAQDHDAVFPVMDANGAMDVVHLLKTSNGLGGFETKRYSYAGLKMHLQGLGNLGMRQTLEIDETGFTIRGFSQDYMKRMQGMLLGDGRVGPGFIGLRSTVNEYEAQRIATPGGARYVVNLKETTTTNADLKGKVVSKTRTQNQELDAHGNITRMRRTVMDANDVAQAVTDTVNDYVNDASIWSLGLLSRLQVTQSLPAANPPVPAVTRVTTQDWNVQRRLLKQEVQEPDVPTLRLVRDYGFDAFGNRTTATASGFDITSRTAVTGYDPTGRFAITGTSPLGHVASSTFDATTGAMLTATDFNRRVTTFEYDGFGRKIRETDADGRDIVSEYLPCSSSCPPNAVYSIRVTPEGGAPSITYLDVLGRELRSETMSLEGRRTFADRRYDARGRNTEVSEPYFEGDAPLWSTMSYDDLDRLTRVLNPDGTFSTMDYDGLTTVMTNELRQQNTTIRNVLDQPVEVRDAQNNSIQYRYDPFENVIETLDPAGNRSLATYDRLGRKITQTDPDKGRLTYNYDALGQLRRVTDAKLQVTEFSYDVLGRQVTRVDDLGGTQQQVTVWKYDRAANAKGKLASIKQRKCSGVLSTCLANADADPEYAELNTYDAQGRPTVVEQRIGKESFFVGKTYDGLGRVETTTYPDSAGQRLKLRNVFNARGYHTQIIDDTNAQTVWTATTTDARGNTTQFTLGNGLITKRGYSPATGFLTSIETGTTPASNSVQNLRTEFDAIGNLKLRTDLRIGLSEKAEYDELNRLRIVTSRLGTQNPVTTVTDYDALGNIKKRTESEDSIYGYGGTCNTIKAGPHAVTSITKGTVTTAYCYDKNGNMTQSGARTIEWAPFDKPTRFKNGTLEAHFDYGPNRERYRRVDVAADGATTTTVYVGGVFERVTTPTSTEYRNFIGDVAVYKRIVTTSTSSAIFYMHHDHLGSVNAVTDAASNVVERFSFDAWGKRRKLTDDERTMTSAHTARGFTNQEQIDAFELVHMNGRVYDPTIGRFISADPFVQDPGNLQSLNRYSYVLNNPLSYTDPSGFFSLKKALRSIGKGIKKAVRGVVKAVKAALRAVAKVWAKVPGLEAVAAVVACVIPGGCAAFAVFSAAVQLSVGASFVDVLPGLGLALIGGGGAVAKPINFASPFSSEFASSVFTAQNAAKVLGGALFGGAAAEARGGKFKDGFLGSLRSSAITTFAQGVLGQLPNAAGNDGKSGAGSTGRMYLGQPVPQEVAYSATARDPRSVFQKIKDFLSQRDVEVGRTSLPAGTPVINITERSIFGTTQTSIIGPIAAAANNADVEEINFQLSLPGNVGTSVVGLAAELVGGGELFGVTAEVVTGVAGLYLDKVGTSVSPGDYIIFRTTITFDPSVGAVPYSTYSIYRDPEAPAYSFIAGDRTRELNMPAR